MKFWLAAAFFFGMQIFSQVSSSGETFKTQKLQIGKQTIIVELADDNAKRQQGLMFRKSLADGHGMIFIFDNEQTLNFWMKNTLIPLDIGYFNAEKELIDIQTMYPASSVEIQPKTYPSKAPAQYALEVPEGWFHKYNIKSGAKFKLL